MRLSELVGLSVGDVDLDHDLVTVLGKGRKVRAISLGANTVAALDRYKRERGRHRLAHLPNFWLGLRDRSPNPVSHRYLPNAPRLPA